MDRKGRDPTVKGQRSLCPQRSTINASPALLQLFDFQVPELDAVAFGLDADVAFGQSAVVEFGGDSAIDPKRNGFAFGGDFHGVPIARLFDTILGGIGAESFFLSLFSGGLAEEESVLGIAELGL